MKEYISFDLYGHNSMRLHSVADHVYEPESAEELIETISRLNGEGKGFHILGGGSNVILPPHVSTPVILMEAACNFITFHADYVHVGASVRLQKLIRTLQDNDLGGIEYLYSVSARVGGILMNEDGRRNIISQSLTTSSPFQC